MASVRDHDLVEVRRQVTAWLTTSAGLAGAEVGEVRTPLTGAVNDTFVYDVTWRGADGGSCCARHVLRTEPRGYSNLRDNDVLEQARFLEALGAHSELPLPKILWIDEEGGPFGRPLYVMEALPGEVAADMPPYALEGWLHDAAPEARRDVYRQAVEALAGVHAVDWRALGIDHLTRDQRPDETPLEAEVRRFLEFMRWGAEGVEYPLLEAAAAWLQDDLPADDERTVLTWNDGRLGNMLFHELRLTGLLDWELVTVGPPELDLAWLVWHDRFSAECLASAMAGRPVAPLEGAPTLEEAASWYEAVSNQAPRALGWFETWAAFRMAVYLMRHGKGMIGAGQAPLESRVDAVNIASIELARMLDLEPPR